MPWVPIEFWLVSFAMLGGILGSYINMAAYRLPRGISTVTRSRSFCPKCDHQLAWYDNLPILSYLQLRGKCRYCKAPIPRRYLFTELLVSFLFVAATYQFFHLNPALLWSPFTGKMPPILFLVQLFLIVDLILLSVVDLEVWLIPIETTLPWAAVGLIIAPIFPELHSAATTWFPITPAGVTTATRLNAFIDSFMGLVIGAGMLWAVGFIVTLGSYYYFRAKGRSDRPLEGMGLGDVHLMAMVGAFLGWKAAMATLMIGVFIGAITGVAKIQYEKYLQKKLGDKYKPWQPEFELPPPPPGEKPPKPSFWMLLVMGLIVVAMGAFQIWQGSQTFGFTPIQTFEESRQVVRSAGIAFPVDFRLFPVYLLLLLGALLVLACFFMNHLAAINMLPQGEIQENEKGEQKEVLQGNYIPFGPSLAAAGIIVVFYDPLIRNAAYWWFALGTNAPFPAMPWRVLGG